MKKKLRKYQFGSQGLASTPINPYTGFSPSISLQEPSSGLGMSKPLDYENDKPKTQLAPSSSLLNKPSLSPAPTSTPYTGISSKPTVSPAFTSTPSIASPQRYASASVKPEAGAPKTAFGATKTGLDQTKLQSSTTNIAPKTNTGATAAGGVASGLNAIGEGVNTYRKFNPVTAGSTSLYNKKEQNILKKINDERDAVTGLEATTAALGTAAGITAAIPVVGWGVAAGLGIAAAGTGISAGLTAANLDKQESTLFKRVSARAEREKREAEGLIKTQEIESMMNSSNPLEVQNEMIDIEEKPMRARMPAYQMGGPRNYAGPMEEPAPNAEVERGEVTQHPNGKVEIEGGKRHEEGGNEKYVPPGAFIWSDHLKYQGKSMAQWFLMFKDSPERVEQLKALQENLASKEKPSKYNDLPQKKYGGELPKYQGGTPFNMVAEAEKEAAAYNATKRVNKPSVPIVTPEQIKAAGFTNLRDYLNAQRGLTRVGGAPAQVPVVTAPITAPAAAYNPNGPLATYASVNGPGYGMNGPLTDYASVYGPGAGYTNASVEETGKTQRAVGEKSKTEQFLGKYGPSIAAGLGGVGQLLALGLAKNPYENLSVPNAAQLSSAQFTALGRNNNEAFTNAAMSGYRALLDDARYRGAGPGDMSQGQIAYNRAMQEIETAQRGVMASNINLAATEAELNQSNDLEVKKFNAAAKNAQIENELALNSARASFEGQKPGLIAGAIGTTVRDGLSFYKDQEKAKAIYGNTSLEKDHYGVDMQAINKKAWQVAEEKAKAAGKTATYADYYKEVSGLLDLLPKQ